MSFFHENTQQTTHNSRTIRMEWHPNHYYYGEIPDNLTKEEAESILAEGLCKKMTEDEQFFKTCQETEELEETIRWDYDMIEYIYRDYETYKDHYKDWLYTWFIHDKIGESRQYHKFYYLFKGKAHFRECCEGIYNLAMYMKENGLPVLK